MNAGKKRLDYLALFGDTQMLIWFHISLSLTLSCIYVRFSQPESDITIKDPVSTSMFISSHLSVTRSIMGLSWAGHKPRSIQALVKAELKDLGRPMLKLGNKDLLFYSKPNPILKVE